MKTKQSWEVFVPPIVCALISAKYVYIVAIGIFYSEVNQLDVDLAVLFILLTVITAMMTRKKK